MSTSEVLVAVPEVLELPKKRGEYGKGSIVQRGKRWQISFYDTEGRRRRESFTTFKQAEKKLSTRLALRDEGKLDAPERRCTIDKLAELYIAYAKGSTPKSAEWIERVWKIHLEPTFGGFLASRIDTEKMLKYRVGRIEAGAATSTVNREMAILRAMFYNGFECDPPKVSRVPKFPKTLREPNPRQGFLTDDQYEALQTHCKHRWLLALMAVAFNYGFRKAELLSLKVGQVNLSDRTIRLLPGTTKNDRGRTAKMTEEVYKLVAECVQGKSSQDAVFCWENGSPVKDFRATWDKMVESAGVPNLLLHDFRRTAVRNMVRAGVSKHVAKKISGHVTDSIFDRYDIPDEADIEDVAMRLENRRIGRKLVTEQANSTQPSVNG